MYKKNILITLLIFVLFLVVGCNEDPVTKSYTIKFDSNCEQKFNDIILTEQSAIELPNPTKYGYTFGGWYPSEDYMSGTEVTKDSIIGKNVTLHAKWDPIPLSITLDAGQGQFSDGSKTKIIKTYYNDTLVFERTYLDNYLFMGWVHNDKSVDENTLFFENVTLTANYLSMEGLNKEYNVTFNLDGGRFYRFRGPSYDSVVTTETVFLTKDDVKEDIGLFNNKFVQLVCDFMKDVLDFTNVNVVTQPKYCRYEMVNRFKKTVKVGLNYKEKTENVVGVGGFFNNVKYRDKWLWLIEYLITTVNKEEKKYLEDIVNDKYLKATDSYEVENEKILSILNDFITKSAEESKKINFDSLVGNNSYGFKSYVVGEETILLTPYLEDCEFLGWYDNPDFLGEKVTKISYNEYGDKEFYAKWRPRG